MTSRTFAFDLDLPDRDAAEFWLEEWQDRYRDNNDMAFKDAAEAMELYIKRRWPFDEETA